MPLTDVTCRNAKPKEKIYRLFDEKGLYLEVSPRGGKWWRLKYRFGGKEKRLSLGTYPDVSLSEARDKRRDFRKLLDNGQDPSQVRQEEKALERAEGETFQTIALEWFDRYKHAFSKPYGKSIIQRLEKDVFPWLGHRAIRELTPPEILACIRRIESRGAAETARRQMQKIGQIMRFAVATGRAERDPTRDLQGSVPPPEKKHFAAITDVREVGALLNAIDGYHGQHTTRCALRLAPLLFVRPGELRKSEWSEFELEGKTPTWRIPPEKMKMRRPHLVPLSRQAVDVLADLYPLTGSGKYLFPGNRGDKPISANTLNAALRYLGYTNDQMTAHGFRAMASTLLNETGWEPDVIEAQLAHTPKNAIRAAYNRSQYLPQRREMMQSWADFLDKLKKDADGKVVPIFKQA
ncbi:tyrosine-type recombinase/integrase [Desulfovibrio sp. Fe33]|uniref:tyrosine-type recombinase/integrase n=1 Tax=Desulfovibrio sp. Fe33 TaxID=3020842 RepID=UPI00234C5462|nr:integrase arm-type DNA-binding domain-containing protein [Desulfovibrio sp. Fe33]